MGVGWWWGGGPWDFRDSPESKIPFPFLDLGLNLGQGLGLGFVNNCSNDIYLFIDTNLIKNVKSISFMFLSTKEILNTRETFLKKNSFLCTGCICLLPCDISRIKSNVQKEDSILIWAFLSSPVEIVAVITHPGETYKRPGIIHASARLKSWAQGLKRLDRLTLKQQKFNLCKLSSFKDLVVGRGLNT